MANVAFPWGTAKIVYQKIRPRKRPARQKKSIQQAIGASKSGWVANLALVGEGGQVGIMGAPDRVAWVRPEKRAWTGRIAGTGGGFRVGTRDLRTGFALGWQSAINRRPPPGA